MADNAAKAVRTDLINTWNRGDELLPLCTDLSNPTSGKDSIDIPSAADVTVNSSETAAVAASSFSTETLSINIDKFVNQGITQQQESQLLNGGAFTSQLSRLCAANLRNSIQREIIEEMIASASHHNLAADAPTENDINDLEGQMREQGGIANSGQGLAWVMNPRAHAKIKNIADFDAGARAPASGAVGLPFIGMINGIPAYLHNGIPGQVDSLRQQAAISAVSVATNDATLTVPTGHGFVVGQQVYTEDLTADGGTAASPVAITAVSATTVNIPITTGDGAMADGVGTLYSASNMAVLMYKPWVFFGLDRTIPSVRQVPREGNAGWTLQMYLRMGRHVRSGAVQLLHC